MDCFSPSQAITHHTAHRARGRLGEIKNWLVLHLRAQFSPAPESRSLGNMKL